MRLRIQVAKIEGQGVDIQRVVDGLRNMKAELQSLGRKVSIKVAGEELEAGNETRTRDILLGKKSVTLTGENENPDTNATPFESSDLAPSHNPELICEHFEIPDNICCEYCNAYSDCPLHFRRAGEYIE